MITDDVVRFCQRYPGRPVQVELPATIADVHALDVDMFSTEEGQVVLIIPEEEPVALIAATVTSTSWLHEPRFAQLLYALRYSASKTNAIPALAKITAEEAASLFTIMRRGWDKYERESNE